MTNQHFAYFELLKSQNDPVLPFLEQVAGDGYVHFNPAHQPAFLGHLSANEWSVIAGRFNAAHPGAKNVLE